MLNTKANKVGLKLVDYTGKMVRELEAKNAPGLHRVSWDLLQPAPPRGGAERPAGPRGGGPQQRLMPAPVGIYRVVLTVDGQEFTQPLRLEGDPNIPAGTAAEEEEKESARSRIDD